MQGRKNYQEKLFTSFQLSDRVPEDNIYRRISELIDFHYLYKKTTAYYGQEGQASIDPVVFFKLILVGYLENIPSDRRILRTASMRMDILYFIGYDIDEPLPWHSTLSRTRSLYGEEVFLTLFQEVLKQCIDKGMLSGRRQAVDSMLVNANASMDSLVEKEILEDAVTFSNELQSNREEADVVQLNSSQQEDKNKSKGRNNKTHRSTTDPDARIATKPGKPSRLNYLGQVSVDTSSYVITGVKAFKADKKDSQCLEEVVKQSRKNLWQSGLIVGEVLADTNYSSTQSLEALKAMQIRGYIPNFGRYKSDREGFTYDKEHDRYICPQGKYLPFKGFKKNHSPSKQYISSSKDCRPCPVKTACVGNRSNHKTITETLSRPLFEEMERRVHSRKGRKMRRIRHSTVEPVIGTLMNFHNAKKVYTRGLSNADKNLMMAAIAYNLKKLVGFTPTRGISNLKALPQGVCSALNDIKSALDTFMTGYRLIYQI